MKPPRRKVLRAYRTRLHWWDFQLSCGHVLRSKNPTDRELAAKMKQCDECALGFCTEGKHDIVDAEGPESPAFKCTKCPYASPR